MVWQDQPLLLLRSQPILDEGQVQILIATIELITDD